VEVSTMVSSYIDDPDKGEYNDGIPKIKGLDFGFYTIPKKEDILNYMMSVDNENLVKHEHIYPYSYISSKAYHGPNYQSSIGPDGEEYKIKPESLST
jgi:hypothetical protein